MKRIVKNLFKARINRDGGEGRATPARWRYHGNTEGSYQGHLFIGEKEKKCETSGENKCNLNIHVFAGSPADRSGLNERRRRYSRRRVLPHEYQFKREGI